MKIKIHEGTAEEVEKSHEVLDNTDGVVIKFGQSHVTWDDENKRLVYSLVDFYEVQQ